MCNMKWTYLLNILDVQYKKLDKIPSYFIQFIMDNIKKYTGQK